MCVCVWMEMESRERKRAREKVNFVFLPFVSSFLSPLKKKKKKKKQNQVFFFFLTSLAHQHDRAQQLGKVRVVGVAVRQLGVGEEALDAQRRRAGDGGLGGGEDAAESEHAAEADEAEGPAGAAGAARRGYLFFFFLGGAERGKREERGEKRGEKRGVERERKLFLSSWKHVCSASLLRRAETPSEVARLKNHAERPLLFLPPPHNLPTRPRYRADELTGAIIGPEGSWSNERDRGNRINFLTLMAKISSVTKRVIWRRLFCSLLLPARCRWHKSARNQENGLARLLSTRMLARGHAEWSQRRGRRPGRERKPLTKCSKALGRRHSRHRERARGKNKQDFDAFFPTARPLSTNLQGASSRANTEHSPLRGERRRRGEGRKLATATSAKEAARRRTVDGGRERRQSTGCFDVFFFPRCQRKREPLDFFLPSAAFFFLSRPPPVRSFSSRERRARTNNHFFDQRRSWKKNCSLTALSNPLSPF